MKLDSFRELLIKKSSDSSLENLITFIKDDVLADMVIESLEKMARSKHKGDSANVPLKYFADEMNEKTDPEMIHDALSHHASRYKSAVKAGRQDLANQHANQLFRIMDLADQAQKHSNGKLHVEAVSPHAWERNAKPDRFTSESEPVKRGNKKPGQFVTDTKGWHYRGNNKKGFELLQQEPHPHYSNETRRHGHKDAYPMEDIRVNGKYLDIKDIPKEELKGYEEHPFDKHPIMEHFEKPASKRTPEEDAAWHKANDEFPTSPHMEKYFENYQDNPERGSNKSSPVHEKTLPATPDTTAVATPATEPAKLSPEDLQAKIAAARKTTP